MATAELELKSPSIPLFSKGELYSRALTLPSMNSGKTLKKGKGIFKRNAL
jgi:hypothetical protein